MHDDDFEWDDAKALRNEARHAVPFDAARLVFRDPFAIEWQDTRFDYGEPRFVTLGEADGRLLVVVHTPRGERIRIISARGAEPHERRRYREENEAD